LQLCFVLRGTVSLQDSAQGLKRPRKDHQQHIDITNLVACGLLLQSGLDAVHLGCKLVSLLRCTHSIGPADVPVKAAQAAG
jgi:hypothetical protein